MEKRVTLRDIAKVTGLHFTTVGLALRRSPRINATTAAMVQAAAQRLGYQQDAMLSALSTYRHHQTRKPAGVLAYITTYPPAEVKTNLMEQQMIAAASARARALGFAIELFQINAPGMSAARLSRILHTRGIQGVMLAPLVPLPGPMPDLDWANFSAIAVGYSIANLRIHRTCAHYAHNIRMAMRILRERGYRRIGLIVQYEIFERSMGIVPGTYLAQQYLLPPEDRVIPLITPKLTRASLRRWLQQQRVDCIMLSMNPQEMLGWLGELDCVVPDQIGVCHTALLEAKDGIAGIDNQVGLLGEAAVNAVVAMLQQNERGLPVHPHTTNIEGRWIEGTTVRSTLTSRHESVT